LQIRIGDMKILLFILSFILLSCNKQYNQQLDLDTCVVDSLIDSSYLDTNYIPHDIDDQ